MADHVVDEVLSFLPRLEMPHVTKQLTDELYMTIMTSGFYLGFDWPTWQLAEGRKLFTDVAELDQADFVTLRKVLTALARHEHFSEGSLLDAIKAGYLQRVLSRLKTLKENGQTVNT